jgi:hypothetical protein
MGMNQCVFNETTASRRKEGTSRKLIIKEMKNENHNWIGARGKKDNWRTLIVGVGGGGFKEAILIKYHLRAAMMDY